jgi:hypothetical protein
MRSLWHSWVGLVLVAGPLAAAPPVKEDVWNAAYLDGARAGYVHTQVQEIQRGGTTILHTNTVLQLTVKRFQDTITMRMETGTDETQEGKVTAVFMKQFLGKQQQLELTGTVDGDELHVKVDGGARQDKRIPWDEKVVGLYRQEHLFQDRQVKPGDHFSYLSFEPTINAVVNTQVTVKDYEQVETPDGKRRLLRVDAVADKLKIPGGSFQLPALVSWLDEGLQVVRSQVELPGLGKMVLNRADKRVATAAIGPSGKGPNLGLNSLLRLNRRIADPYNTETAVYRITLKDDDDPGTAFAQDGRQKVRNVKGNHFELVIQASRGPQPVDQDPGVAEEFLQSCYFINCDDARVKDHARRAVGDARDAWVKARRIEHYVHDHMDRKNFTEAFATADEVARTMEGDCTEHAMLAAAMCRAVGVPSRTALGLVYVDDRRQGPVLGFHMWAEVWVHGQWLPIDATLGQGYVGATHLKIADHSWHDIQSLTPLLPVLRVLGKLSIEVLEAN